MTIAIPGGQLHALAPESARHTRRRTAPVWVKDVPQHFESPREVPVAAASTDDRRGAGSLNIRGQQSSDSSDIARRQFVKRNGAGAQGAGRSGTPPAEITDSNDSVAP